MIQVDFVITHLKKFFSNQILCISKRYKSSRPTSETLLNCFLLHFSGCICGLKIEKNDISNSCFYLHSYNMMHKYYTLNREREKYNYGKRELPQNWEKAAASSGKYLGFEKSPGQPNPIRAAIMWLQAPTFRCPLEKDSEFAK